jgi:hypothetical protein
VFNNDDIFVIDFCHLFRGQVCLRLAFQSFRRHLKLFLEGEIVAAVQILNLIDPCLLVVRSDEENDNLECPLPELVKAKELKAINGVANEDEQRGEPVDKDGAQHRNVGEENVQPVDHVVVLDEESDEPEEKDGVPHRVDGPSLQAPAETSDTRVESSSATVSHHKAGCKVDHYAEDAPVDGDFVVVNAARALLELGASLVLVGIAEVLNDGLQLDRLCNLHIN